MSTLDDLGLTFIPTSGHTEYILNLLLAFKIACRFGLD